jgi:chromosome segregation ATPase
MKKLEELKKRLGLIAMADERPALWRLCRSLVESLDEVQKEYDAELEELREKVTAAEANSEECENERRATEEKVTELEGQLRAMSDLANSAMADAQKWQNAYLNLRVETPIVQKTDAIWNMPDGAAIMSQQAETALKAQEERIPRNGYHKYHIKYYNYGDHRWHETELWCRGVKDVEDWVLGVCGGGVPVYDCKVVA